MKVERCYITCHGKLLAEQPGFLYMSLIARKPAFCICENKDADQLRGNREADQRICFRYTDTTIPLLSKSEFQASSHLLWLYRPVCLGPGRKPRRPVFSQRGSYSCVVLFSFFVVVFTPSNVIL